MQKDAFICDFLERGMADIRTIGERLKGERERLGLTQEQGAHIAGASKRTIAAWEGGDSSPTAMQLSALGAGGFDVAYIVLGARQGAAPAKPAEQAPAARPPQYLLARPQPESAPPPGLVIEAEDYVFVPRFDVAALAGHGAQIENESILDYMAFRRDWVVSAMGLDLQWLALARVEGDSMRPTMEDGDLVLLDRRPAPRVRDGIYFLDMGGGLIAKRLQHCVDGSIDVISDNPLYRNENLAGEALQNLRLAGRVAWHARVMI